MVDYNCYHEHLLKLMSTNEELKKSVEGITKQTLWSAGGTITGGVIGGPIGALAGGLFGAAVGYFTADDYKSVIDVLQNLDNDEKQELVKRVQQLVGSTQPSDLTKWIENSINHPKLIELVKLFLENIE